MSQTLEQWYTSIPPVTKTLLLGILSSTILFMTGVVDPFVLILDWDLIIYRFQLWRLVTCFFFLGSISFQFLIQIFMLVRYSSELENGYYPGLRGAGEYTFHIFLMCTLMLVVSYFVRVFYFLTVPLHLAIIYTWSRKTPDRPISIYGFLFQSWHLPFVMVVLTLIMGGSIFPDLLGLFAGHSLHFLKDVLPAVYRVTIISTPDFFYDMYDTGRNRPAPMPRAGGYRVG